MENFLLILVIVLLALVVILIAVMSFLGFKFLKLKEKSLHEKEVEKSFEPEVDLSLSTKTKKKKIDPELLNSLRAKKFDKAPNIYCVDHPEEFSNGKCAISGDSYCEHCLTKQGDIKIARKFLDLYLDNEWVEVLMIANENSNKDLKDRLFKIKKSLWENESLPVIVQGHYKINVEADEIEEFIVVLSRVDDLNYVKNELDFLN